MRRLPVLLVLLLAAAASGTNQQHSRAQRSQHLHKLFGALDSDRDGQLARQELSTAIGALGSSSSSQQAQQLTLEQSVEAAVGRLDSPDAGLGVSEAELEQHLQKLCAVMGSVADWVAYGLGLPQYAEAFRSNAITALDFPMLVNDGGVLLDAELQVHSQLHLQKLVRAMKRQILGLGSPPGLFPAHSLACSLVGAAMQQHQMLRQPGGAAASAAAAVACSWQPPTDPGQPPMHAYVLERLDASHAAPSWRLVALLPDSLTSRFTDVGVQPGEYTYRLTAWNACGRAPWAVSSDVVAPAAVQQAPASAAAATEAECPAGSDGLVQQHQQSAECSTSPSSVMLAAGPAQGNSNAVWLVSLPREQLLLPNPTTPAAWGAHQQLIATMRAAAAATGTGGNDSTNHGAASMQQGAGGRQASTGIAALLGTAWQSSMGSWLRALLHSFVLLVLPVCVRLLPVQVLAHAARRLAQLLQLLPESWRRRLLLLHDARMQPQQQQQVQPPSRLPHSSSGGSTTSAAQKAAPISSIGQQQQQVVAGSSSSPGCETAVGSSGSITQPPASPGLRQALLTALKHSPAAVQADAPAERVATAPAAAPGDTLSLSLGVLRAAAGLPRCRSEATLVQQQRVVVSSSGHALGADAWLCAAEEQQQQQPGAPLQLDVRQQLAWRLSQQQLQDPPGRKRCGFPGCQQQFDLRNWRALLQRHYCGRCQAAFCLQHTAYSPHGAGGTCGVQSRCLCTACYAEFTPEYRAFLASRNTLSAGGGGGSTRSRSGPPLTTAAPDVAAGSSSSSGLGSSRERCWGARSAVLLVGRRGVSSLAGGEELSGAAAGVGAGQEEQQEHREQQQEQEEQQEHQQQQQEQDGEQPLLAAAGGQGTNRCTSSRMLWRRAMNKATGVVRFRHAAAAAAAARAASHEAGPDVCENQAYA